MSEQAPQDFLFDANHTEIYEQILSGCDDKLERAARIGRFLILEEMGFFGESTNIDLARGEYAGTFVAATRKRFSGIYGDVAGCHPADLEIAAEMLGVFDAVYDLDYERGRNAKRKQAV